MRPSVMRGPRRGHLQAFLLLAGMGVAGGTLPAFAGDCRPAGGAAGVVVTPCLQPAWPQANEALLPPKGPAPDLRAQIGGPAEGHAGQDIGPAIRLVIENQGDAAAAAGFTVEIGLLMAPEEEPAMYRALARLASPVSLAPRESRQYHVANVIIPQNFQWGTNAYRLCVRVDPANRLREADRRNNMSCADIRIEPDAGGGG